MTETTSYTMTVSAASALRVERARLAAEIRVMRTTKPVPYAKIKKLDILYDTLSAQLIGAPAEPITETAALAIIREWLEYYHTNYDDCKSKFITSFINNPENALKWDAQGVVLAQTHMGYAEDIIRWATNLAAADTVSPPTFAHYLAAITGIREKLTADQIEKFYQPSSCSQQSNVHEATKIEARVKFLREIRCFDYRLTTLIAGVASSQQAAREQAVA